MSGLDRVGLRAALERLIADAETDAFEAAGPVQAGFDAHFKRSKVYGRVYDQRLQDGLASLADNGAALAFGYRPPHEHTFRAHGRRATSTASLTGAIRNWIAAEEKAEGKAA